MFSTDLLSTIFRSREEMLVVGLSANNQQDFDFTEQPAARILEILEQLVTFFMTTEDNIRIKIWSFQEFIVYVSD